MELRLTQLCVQGSNADKPLVSIPHFQLQRGEQLAILGHSGAGKSTLLNALCGLIRTAHGQVFWDGQDIQRFSQSRLDAWRFAHVGLVMQDFHLTGGLSALDNVLLPYAFRHWRVAESVRQRALELLAQMNFHTPYRPIEQLSRGEMQRVAIARALLPKPQVIIADEPTASLDKKNGEIITALLRELAAQEQCSLLVATHDPQLGSALPRRIYLEDGNIVREENHVNA